MFNIDFYKEDKDGFIARILEGSQTVRHVSTLWALSIPAPSQLSGDHTMQQPVSRTTLAYPQYISLPMAGYSLTVIRVRKVRRSTLSKETTSVICGYG